LNDRDDLLIGEESAKLFNFHSYAIRNFSQHTSGVFRRKTVTAGQLLCFSMVRGFLIDSLTDDSSCSCPLSPPPPLSNGLFQQPLAGALTRAVGEDENKNKIAIEISRSTCEPGRSRVVFNT
jgi:hypothetical protein